MDTRTIEDLELRNDLACTSRAERRRLGKHLAKVVDYKRTEATRIRDEERRVARLIKRLGVRNASA